jgi:hypothetical protein
MGVKKITPSWTSCGNFLLPQENMIFFKNIKNVLNRTSKAPKYSNFSNIIILPVIFERGRLP